MTLLLLRKNERLWGVARSEVRTVARGREGVRVGLGGGELVCDAVATPAHELSVHPAGAVSRNLLGEPFAGFALFAGEGVVVFDADGAPPAVLRRQANREERHGE